MTEPGGSDAASFDAAALPSEAAGGASAAEGAPAAGNVAAAAAEASDTPTVVDRGRGVAVAPAGR